MDADWFVPPRRRGDVGFLRFQSSTCLDWSNRSKPADLTRQQSTEREAIDSISLGFFTSTRISIFVIKAGASKTAKLF